MFQRDTISDATSLQPLSKMILPCMSTVPSKEIAAFTAGTMTKTNHVNGNGNEASNPFLGIFALAGVLAVSSTSGDDTKFVHAAKRKRGSGSSVTPT